MLLTHKASLYGHLSVLYWANRG